MHWKTAAITPSEDVMRELSSSFFGISSSEAIDRIEKYGFNEIKGHDTLWWHIILRQFQSSFVYLLAAAALLSFILGEHIEALMMMLFLLLNTTLGFLQEYRSTKALKFLKGYLVSKTKVIRDHQEKLIESTEIVPGDVIVLAAGDKIPADIRIIEARNCVVDEEILTGESVSVYKDEKGIANDSLQLHQASNVGFSGTTILRGRLKGIVLSTGKDTAVGEIAHLMDSTEHQSSFEKGIEGFSIFIVRLVVVTLLLVFVANIAIKGESANIIELLIFSLVLVISVIPEALPFMTTVSLSRGSLRLAKKHVIVKRLSAIEDLGSLEVLCSDKTGTLTENVLTVDRVNAENKDECIFAGCLASDVVGLIHHKKVDPFDMAFWNHMKRSDKYRVTKMKKIDELPFDPARRRNGVLIMKEDGSQELIVRGAPESILSISSSVTNNEKDRYLEWVRMQGEDGKRVLGVARRIFLKDEVFNEASEKNMDFIGMISFVDPIKATTRDAVKKAQSLGIDVKIITGDSKEVSGSVAFQIGLISSSHQVLLGEELDAMTYEDKVESVHKYSVFARVSPKQKYDIIKLLQETKEVGFLGEGINDAPALKLANVALVVNGASDIAREAADVVLLDSSLKVIVDGVKEGRLIFSNMIKYIKTTLASSFGNFYSVAIASLLIPFVPMLPLQILLIDILSDLPMLSLSTDSVDSDELKKPRGYQVRHVVLVAMVFGVVSSLFDFILFASFYQKGEGVLQTNWFMLSVLTELILIFSLRTRKFMFQAKRPSKILLISSIILFFLAIVIPFSEFGEHIFHFVRPQGLSVIWIVSLVICYIIATEIVKYLYYHLTRENKVSL